MTEVILVVRTVSAFYEFYKQLLTKIIPKKTDSITNLKKK